MGVSTNPPTHTAVNQLQKSLSISKKCFSLDSSFSPPASPCLSMSTRPSQQMPSLETLRYVILWIYFCLSVFLSFCLSVFLSFCLSFYQQMQQSLETLRYVILWITEMRITNITNQT